MISPRSKGLGLRNPAVLAGLVIFGLFGLVWVLIILPVLSSSSSFYTLSPLLAYPIYNVGFLFLTIAFFGYFFGSILLGQHFNLVTGLKLGVSGWLTFSFVLDMLAPPVFLSPTGQVLIPLGTSSLENVAVDAFASVAFVSLFPWIQGTPALYYLTYLVTPFLVLVIAAIILTPKQFIRGLMSGAA